MKENNNFYLTTTPVGKLLLKFSIPCILSMLVSALYNIVDQIFIGNSVAGTAGIMATTLVFPFTVIALALALLIGDGCASLFSISLGSKDLNTSKKCVGNTLIMVIILGVLLSLLGLIGKDFILGILGIGGYNKECQLFTEQYFLIILLGIPFYMITSATSSLIRADGSPVYSMVATVVGAVINLILDPVLIFLFDLGINGAAIATIVGQIVSAIVCLVYFRKTKLISLSRESFKLNGKVCLNILKLGISSFITQVSIAIITIVANRVVGAIGGVHATDAGGALGIVFKVFAIVIAFSIGVSVGGQPIIGYNYGAGQYKRVLDTYKYIIGANLIIGLVAFLLFELAPGLIVSVFGGYANDLEFYQNYAILSFRIYLGGILFCCIQKSSCIFLQSIDRPYKAMILSLMRDVVLLVPGVCLLGLYGDLYLMLWAGVVADVGSFIVTIILVSKECKKIKVLINNLNDKKEVNFSKDNHLVITIGREFGSGGKYIGEELAKRLGINCYDNELLQQVALENDLDLKLLESVDEKVKSSFWYGFASNFVNDKDGKLKPISAEDNLFLKQARVIEELYDKESCVIIGRCSDYILRNKKNVVKVFVYANDEKFKINRKKDLEQVNCNKIKNKIRNIDKERSDYYKRFTGCVWGSKDNYDILIDTSVLGVDETIDFLESYVKIKKF